MRAMAFPTAYFEKDNDARSGSKGDFIFRESDAAGTEIVSIMFEMKNENDETATKRKNEDFLKELDRDRTEKGFLLSRLQTSFYKVAHLVFCPLLIVTSLRASLCGRNKYRGRR